MVPGTAHLVLHGPGTAHLVLHGSRNCALSVTWSRSCALGVTWFRNLVCISLEYIKSIKQRSLTSDTHKHVFFIAWLLFFLHLHHPKHLLKGRHHTFPHGLRTFTKNNINNLPYTQLHVRQDTSYISRLMIKVSSDCV